MTRHFLFIYVILKNIKLENIQNETNIRKKCLRLGTFSL